MEKLRTMLTEEEVLNLHQLRTMQKRITRIAQAFLFPMSAFIIWQIAYIVLRVPESVAVFVALISAIVATVLTPRLLWNAAADWPV